PRRADGDAGCQAAGRQHAGRPQRQSGARAQEGAALMATIIVQPGGVRAGRQRVNLTAIAHNRLMLLLILFLAITAILIGRLTWVGFFADSGRGGDGLSGLLPARADIVDRNGVPLARTMDAYSI